MSTYERVEDDYGIFYWKRCIIHDCPYFVCLGASELYCYIHTLQDLLKRQIKMMNYTDTIDIANSLVPRNSLWVGDKAAMEEMLLKFAENEVNYCGLDWKISALEILRIMALEDA